MHLMNPRIAMAGLLCVVALRAWTQGQDAEGCKDHPLVSRYPGSVITECRASEFDEVTLPLGKTDDDRIPAKKLQLEGKVTRIAYTAPAHRSALEIYRNYEMAFKSAGFEVLFSCVNNDGCGAKGPTLWAAQGGEDWAWSSGQRYLSAKLSRSDGDSYVSLHVGQDANDNGDPVVLYIVESKAMDQGLVNVDAAALGNDIARTGHTAVYGIYFDTGKADVKPESDAALKEIAKLLQQDSSLRLYVVGHTDNVGALAGNMDLSRRRGDAVVKVLTTQYSVAAARLLAEGDGPIAPVASNDTEEGRAKNRRVELVKQ